MLNRKYFVGLGVIASLAALVAFLPDNLAQGERTGLDFAYFNGVNVTRGSSQSNSLPADLGDELRFETKLVNNTGNYIGGIQLRVELPGSLYLIPESIIIHNWSGSSTYVNYPANQPMPIMAGDLWPGEERIILFNARVSRLPRSSETVTLRLESEGYPYAATARLAINPNLNEGDLNQYNPLQVTKLARNLSRGETQWNKSVVAQPGDEVEFQINLSTSDPNGARGVFLKEQLDPGYLDYLVDSFRINNRQSYIRSINDEISLGDLARFQTTQINLRARVAPSYSFPQREIIVSNLARTRLSGYAEQTTAAGVKVVNYSVSEPVYYQPTPTPVYYTHTPTPRPLYRYVPPQNYQAPQYTPGSTGSPQATPTPTSSGLQTVLVGKLVRNLTNRQAEFAPSITAAPGDELEFIVYVTATGPAPINQLILRDELPGKLVYQSRSLMVNRQSTEETLFNVGLPINYLQPNETREVTYRVKVAPAEEFDQDQTELRAAALATGENIASEPSIISVTIKKDGDSSETGTVSAGWFWTIVILLLFTVLLLFVLWRQEKQRVELLVSGRLV